MELGLIGLGRMGMNMARRLARGGHRVVAWNRSPDKAVALAAEEPGVMAATDPAELAASLARPRLVWLMLPAGAPVDEQLAGLVPHLAPGDVVVDGGNSHYKDAGRRQAVLAGTGVILADAGVSGGVWGLAEGYCLMVGGPAEAFDLMEPALATLAPETPKNDGYMHCGPLGAGHFVKMVHNGIEYGMMQAYAEGFHILEASEFGPGLDLAALAGLWNRGSVIRSWLLELAEAALADDPRLESLEPWVDDSGEGRWTVDAAVELAVPAPVMALSLMARFRSRTPDSFADRMLAALRREFGGHGVRTRDEGA